eukprot:CAMPEP_0181306712 /NCGR_PEP_ID=MMETSP1101-20121128/10459_1 /TAXON_ID=46948 /ORGANISM="Rhodomonas abbreviata, Strain Caron Lab Isolate" /LENGTH=154 /DNA_ID=CAMNT_0023412813 /DNA_START=494 /DNA_END=958 /DNA_ORIENTATION=+
MPSKLSMLFGALQLLSAIGGKRYEACDSSLKKMRSSTPPKHTEFLRFPLVGLLVGEVLVELALGMAGSTPKKHTECRRFWTWIMELELEQDRSLATVFHSDGLAKFCVDSLGTDLWSRSEKGPSVEICFAFGSSILTSAGQAKILESMGGPQLF